MAFLLIKNGQKKTGGLFLWLFCLTYTCGGELYDCQILITECVKNGINLSVRKVLVTCLIFWLGNFKKTKTAIDYRTIGSYNRVM